MLAWIFGTGIGVGALRWAEQARKGFCHDHLVQDRGVAQSLPFFPVGQALRVLTVSRKRQNQRVRPSLRLLIENIERVPLLRVCEVSSCSTPWSNHREGEAKREPSHAPRTSEATRLNVRRTRSETERVASSVDASHGESRLAGGAQHATITVLANKRNTQYALYLAPVLQNTHPPKNSNGR